MNTSDGVVIGKGRSALELARLINPEYSLTAEQIAIVEAGTAPALVVAGAGSGKTETLSLRIVYVLDHARRLVGRDLAPDEILCLTFTRKAAAEIAHRAAARIGAVFGDDPARPEPAVATYNGYAAGLVAEHGLRVAVDPGASVLTDAALWQLADAVVQSWTDPVDSEAAVSTITAALPRLAAQARDHRVSPERLSEWARAALTHLDALPKKAGDASPGTLTGQVAVAVGKVRTLASLADMIADFDRRKRESSLLDFSDQVDIAVRLADVDAVCALERQRYAAVLLDEFQDTSPPQLDLFARMFGPEHPVMAVGDPHQAIYGFRGASAGALTQFVERFGSDRVERHQLTVSWRNEASILAAANSVVASLASPSAAAPAALRSKAQELGLPEPARSAPGVVASRHLTSADEAAAVVDFITARRRELGAADGELPTAAVLCRRRVQFEQITAALAARGVAFEVVGLGGLLDVPEIADILAALQVAHDPSRGDSLMRLLTGERLSLGPADLAALRDRARDLTPEGGERASIVDALAALPQPGWVSRDGRSLTEAALHRLTKLQRAIDHIRRHTYLEVGELVVLAERTLGLDIEVAVARPDGASRRAVDALADAARTFSAGASHATLGAFLAWLDAARTHEDGLDAPVRDLDPRAVQVLTVHAAKGLEWDIVAVPGLNDGHFPSIDPPTASSPEYTDSGWLDGVGKLPHELRLDADGLAHWAFRAARDHRELAASLADFKVASGASRLAEERRLFYVALTRARSHVLLSGAWFSTGTRPRQPSPVLLELADAGLAIRGAWTPEPEDNATAPREVVAASWPRLPSPSDEVRRALAALVERAAVDVDGHPDSGEPLAREIGAMLAERAERSSRGAEVELPSHVSTSALVALKRSAADYALGVRRPIPVEPSLAAHRGSAIHAWIEAHFGHLPLWEDEEEDLAGEDLGAIKDAFLGSEWATRVPTHVEADVELAVGAVTVRSRIDAVFPPGAGLGKVTVVDWKTGSPPSDPQEREAREVQLAMYRLAWAARTGVDVDQIDAAFHYVGAGVTVYPATLMSKEELSRLTAQA